MENWAADGREAIRAGPASGKTAITRERNGSYPLPLTPRSNTFGMGQPRRIDS
jgi:hypothetical protein